MYLSTINLLHLHGHYSQKAKRWHSISDLARQTHSCFQNGSAYPLQPPQNHLSPFPTRKHRVFPSKIHGALILWPDPPFTSNYNMPKCVWKAREKGGILQRMGTYWLNPVKSWTVRLRDGQYLFNVHHMPGTRQRLSHTLPSRNH